MPLCLDVRHGSYLPALPLPAGHSWQARRGSLAAGKRPVFHLARSALANPLQALLLPLPSACRAAEEHQTRGKAGKWQDVPQPTCQEARGKEGWQDDPRPTCHLPALPMPSARGAGEEHQMSPDEHQHQAEHTSLAEPAGTKDHRGPRRDERCIS